MQRHAVSSLSLVQLLPKAWKHAGEPVEDMATVASAVLDPGTLIISPLRLGKETILC